MHEPILRVAAKAAIVSSKGHVLIAREAAAHTSNTMSSFYSLIGGRLKRGEAFLDGLHREVLEETGLTVTVERPLRIGEWRPTIHGVSQQVIAIFMLCHTDSTDVIMSAEHDSLLWIDPKDRKNYPMMEPDCFVVDSLAK